VGLPPVPLAPRRGFSLPDLLIGLVLLGAVATLAVRSALVAGRVLRGAQGRAALESAFGTVANYLADDWRDLGRGDLLQAGDDSVRYRGFRSAGLACRVTATDVLVRSDGFSRTRAPEPGRDSLLVLVPGDSGAVWLAGPITAVTLGQCAGVSALGLRTALDANRLPSGGISSLTPVRTFEVMQARFYRSLGAWWLGVRSASTGEVIQPLAGPFEPVRSGFRFLDSAGAETAVPDRARAIVLSLVGRSVAWTGSAMREDSIEVRFHPRNLGQ
jgi:hypothetical protein